MEKNLLYADEGKLTEEAVQGAQGAKETAECTENENASNDGEYHQREFPSEQRAKSCKFFVVCRIQKQTQAPFKRPGGANIFAKSGDCKRHRNDYDKRDQDHVFKIG